MSKKQLYIFVGTHKTGSSFLHKTLQGMGSRIHAFGCRYEPRSVWLAKHLQGEGASPDRLSRARFRGEFDFAFDECPDLNQLMVSEQFMGSPNTGYVDCERIALGLRSVFHDFDVHILMSFRRQDHFLESWYGQSIKEGGTWGIEEFLSQIPVEQFDWFRIANIYEKIFGKSSVRICRYDDLFQVPSEILNKHFNGWAYQGSLELAEASVINPGLSASGLELFRMANEKYGHEARASLRTVFEANFARVPFSGTQLFSDTRRRELLDVFAQSNERLAQRYDLTPFGAEISDLNCDTPTTEVNQADAHSVELSVLGALSEVNQLARGNHAKETSALIRKHAQENAALSREHKDGIKQLEGQLRADYAEQDHKFKQQVQVLTESLATRDHEVKGVRKKLAKNKSENEQLLVSIEAERTRVSELESSCKRLSALELRLKKLAKTRSENEQLLVRLESERKRVSELESSCERLSGLELRLKKLAKTRSENEQLLVSLELERKRVSELESSCERLSGLELRLKKLVKTKSKNEQLLVSIELEQQRASELELRLKKLVKAKSKHEQLLVSLDVERKRVRELVLSLKKLIEEAVIANTKIADSRSAFLVKDSLRACTRKLEGGMNAVFVSEEKAVAKKTIKKGKSGKRPSIVPTTEGRPSNPFLDKESPEVKKWMGGLKQVSKEEKDLLWRSYRQAVYKDSGEYAALMRLKDIHKGKRCFIIGNGPSLVEQDISLMANEVSFVSNWFVNSDRYSELMPKYYCVSSHEMFGGWNKPEPKLNQDFYERIQDRAKSSRKFFSFAFRDYMKSSGMFADEAVNYALFERPKHVVDLKGGINLDLDKHLDDGYTVLLSMCVPLAVHMGCTEIYMVGCDCDYGIKKADDPKKYFYDPKLHTSSTTSFDSLDRIWAEGGPVFTSYSIVLKKLESLGVSFCNATKGGRLDVIPRVKYEDLFNF